MKLPDNDEVYIPSQSRLGFTVEGINPISFDFQEGYNTYFDKINSAADYPVVGQQMEFLRIPYPAVFSIAVKIDTRTSILFGSRWFGIIRYT